MTPVPESVEEAVEALKGLRSAAAFDPEDVRISQDEKDLCAKAQRGIDTALAALAQGPKEAAQPPSLTFTDAQVEAAARAYDPTLWAWINEATDSVAEMQNKVRSRAGALAQMRAALSTLEPR